MDSARITRTNKPSVLLGATSLDFDGGGISRVAHLTASVLGDLAARGELGARAVVLANGGDWRQGGEHPLELESTKGSRWRFALQVHRRSLAASHLVFDHLGMARARPRLPLMRRPFLVWACGIEIWEAATPARITTARSASSMVCISHHTLAKARRLHGGFEGTPVCWLSTATDEPPPTRAGRDTPRRVLVVARMDASEDYKGHHELISCWPRVRSSVPDAILTLVGRGNLRPALERLASECGVREQVEFRGFVSETELDALWGETDVFAMPSRGEGFGLVYIEAMRHGIPVVASIHDAGAEVNVDGETGFNVDLNDPEQLPTRLVELLSSPDLARCMGARGFERWTEHFCYRAFRERFTPILLDFLNLP